MLPAQLFHRYAGFGFFQDVNDLAFRELRLLHVDHSLLYFAMSFPLSSGTILGDGYHMAVPKQGLGYFTARLSRQVDGFRFAVHMSINPKPRFAKCPKTRHALLGNRSFVPEK